MSMQFFEYLSVFKTVGRLYISLKKMFSEIFIWLLFALFPTIGFSLAFTLLTPGKIMAQSDANWPFFLTFWGVLGQFDIDDISEYTPPESYFGNQLTHGFLWVYLFWTTVVLVNLLIAQMSSAYTKVEEMATQLHDCASPLLALFGSLARQQPSPPLLWCSLGGCERALTTRAYACPNHRAGEYMVLVRNAKDMMSPWAPPLNCWLFINYAWQSCMRSCARPHHDTPKGFQWTTETTHSRLIVEAQKKFAMRSIKKRLEAEEGSMEMKIEKITSQQASFEASLEQMNEAIGSFIQSLKEEGESRGRRDGSPAKTRGSGERDAADKKAVSPAHVKPSTEDAKTTVAHREAPAAPPAAAAAPVAPPGLPSHRTAPEPPVAQGTLAPSPSSAPPLASEQPPGAQ